MCFGPPFELVPLREQSFSVHHQSLVVVLCLADGAAVPGDLTVHRVQVRRQLTETDTPQRDSLLKQTHRETAY